jgi:hypothetical protein
MIKINNFKLKIKLYLKINNKMTKDMKILIKYNHNTKISLFNKLKNPNYMLDLFKILMIF